MDNVLTEGMIRAYNILKNTNKRLGEMGKMPYGKRKATPAEMKEQRAAAEQAELEELLYG